jgi:hypothetical protein
VAPFEHEGGAAVIEIPDWRIPMNQVEALSVMIGMAPGTRPSGAVRSDERRMKSPVVVQTLANVRVAF